MWVIASVCGAPCGPADDDEDQGPRRHDRALLLCVLMVLRPVRARAAAALGVEGRAARGCRRCLNATEVERRMHFSRSAWTEAKPPNGRLNHLNASVH